MASEDAIMHNFFKSPSFAVLGASTDRAKYGNKVLRWYQARDMKVVPVNPKEKEVEGLKAITNLSELEDPTNFSVSIITPPKITLQTLKEFADKGFGGFWLQPGAEDAEVLKFIKETPSLKEKTIAGGPCILVLGDDYRRHAAL